MGLFRCVKTTYGNGKFYEVNKEYQFDGEPINKHFKEVQGPILPEEVKPVKRGRKEKAPEPEDIGESNGDQSS